MPCKVLGEPRSSGEHQSSGVYATRFRLAAKVRGCDGTVFDQPENAAFGPSQDAGPEVERPRSDLVVVVETAEHECVRRQAQFGASERALGNGAVAVVYLVASRQPDHLFRV